MWWPFVTKNTLREELKAQRGRIEGDYQWQIDVLNNKVKELNMTIEQAMDALGYKIQYTQAVPARPGYYTVVKKEQDSGIGQ